MKTWRGHWYYLATGMEGRADEWPLGYVDAETEDEARQLFAEREAPETSPGWTRADLVAWCKTCISVTENHQTET